ncbi:hypothetical protein CCHR01_10291 [Colletotrichum chrysophilum]|uniref:Uncharacterized protein n=1 Tax=Colletotrichum chrysophilum TaxID=1836956 RepID=A0AAD9EG08_9PEZI|nr:hypothetical protein CCHR01_10291 [Colletotrichum chrysophilum]
MDRASGRGVARLPHPPMRKRVLKLDWRRGLRVVSPAQMRRGGAERRSGPGQSLFQTSIASIHGVGHLRTSVCTDTDATHGLRSRSAGLHSCCSVPTSHFWGARRSIR